MASNNTNKIEPVNPETTFFFLSSILQKAENFARHQDNQTSILVGLSAGIFVLSISQINNNNMTFIVSLIILAVSSLFSAIIALFALIPFKFMRKKGQKESLLYNKEIASLESSNQYFKKIKDISRDLNQITEQYAIEIYNISRYYYRPKRRLFKISRQLLCTGVVLSLLAFLCRLFFGIF